MRRGYIAVNPLKALARHERPTIEREPKRVLSAEYAFEKGAERIGGGDGFADVWRRCYFAWEYKGKRKDLGAAYQQLLQYREALDNPPLLVVCDLDRFEVHTNFTNTPATDYSFSLVDLLDKPAEPLRLLVGWIKDYGGERGAKEMCPSRLT